jgi:hypothetical protein
VRGLAWTTLHEVACWFACVHRSCGANPLVLKATVDASEFIYWSNDRKENEVILRRPPIAEVDGHSERWQEIAAHWEEAIRRRDRRLTDKFIKTTAKSSKHDWSRFDIISDAQRRAAATRDLDAKPLKLADFKRMKRSP